MDMQETVADAKELIGNIVAAHLSASKAAAQELKRAVQAASEQLAMEAEIGTERLRMEMDVARATIRLEGYTSVLGLLARQKQSLAEQVNALTDPDGPQGKALTFQLEVLTRQESMVLASLTGQPLKQIEADPKNDKPTHRRDGRRFAKAS